MCDIIPLVNGGIMRKVDLRVNEKYKYEIIKKLIETNGNKDRAALKLNCTRRTIDRLIIVYKEKGKEGFIHGNRNRVPVNYISKDMRERIISLYENKYYDSNLTHFAELLELHEDIVVSNTCLNNILREKNMLSPKAHRKTKRELKAKLKKELVVSNKKETIEILDRIDSIERYEAHPRRPRCAYFGELVQMDASEHIWYDGQKTHLHLAIDDATGKVLGGYFDTQETLKGYYNLLNIILTDYGIPAKFLTDNRTVFEYKLKNAPSDQEDTFTQFGYACHQLGISLDTTSVPQAKGRIERLNQSFQSRLVVELRLANVQSLEQANYYLIDFLKRYNAKFEIPIDKRKTVFEASPSKEVINTTLAIISKRKIDNGHCIKFENKYYAPVNSNNSKVYYPKGIDVMVIQAFDGTKYVNIQDNLFALEEVIQRELYSKEFDNVPVKKPKKKYIPPLSHPWRTSSITSFTSTQKHRSDFGAHV